jgi:hypothetical protein
MPHGVLRVVLCLSLVTALPVLGQTTAQAGARAAAIVQSTSPGAPASRAMPMLSESPALRATRSTTAVHKHHSVAPKVRGRSDAIASANAASGGESGSVASPMTAPTTPDDLLGFAGTAQASNIHSFGADQEVTPPSDDIAVGPNDLVEVVNSSIVVLTRTGTILGSDDLNALMNVDPGYYSSDPRVIFDVETGRYWVTVTEVPDSGCKAAPVLIAVSGSSNPLPLGSWTVYSLPIFTSGTTFGDQPGLGSDKNTIVVTFDDFNCSLDFLGSETDILQSSDLANDTITANTDDPFTSDEFAPQPVESLLEFPDDYVLTNESDCGAVACANPEAQVDWYQGTPEGGGMFVQTSFIPMSPTAVDNTTGFLPPADQPSPGPKLQTNDDRFLNAVETSGGAIWTADGTTCFPPGDSVQRACLDYLELNSNAGNQGPGFLQQINNVGVDGADLYYPAVAVDGGGNLLTVFDESSTSMDPSIVDAYIPQGGTTLSTFQTLHTSSTYYNGNDLFSGACVSDVCRWGDYSGAAEDQAEDGNDVWVVSGSEDNTIEGPCVAHACWNTRINQLTLGGPLLNSINPGVVPLVGGSTETVTGHDIAADTTASVTDDQTTVPVTVHVLTPESFTFVAPATLPTSPTGGYVTLVATDSLGSNQVGFYYVGLANYVPVSPFRVLDTRVPGGGGALGPGSVRQVQVYGVGSTPVPQTAMAYVLNITEVNGTAASLLTVYSSQVRPTASNLNFAAHTVIANLVTVTTAGSGFIDIYNALGSVNVLVDVEGYFEPEPSTDDEGLFHPIAPYRVCDTRHPSPTPFCSTHGAMGPETSMAVNVTGTSQIPSDGTAGSVVVNLTGVAGSASTYLSLFPTDSSGGCQYTGSHAPSFSTINLPAGAVQANRVMVQLGPAFTGGPDTSLCVYNSAGTINVLIDANGWYGSSTATASPAGYQYQGIEPTRICDTRISTTSCLLGSIGAAASRRIPVAGDSYLPASTSGTIVVAVIANLTAVAPTATTFLTLYPANLTGRPQASDLNLNAGVVLPNLAVVQLDTTGDANDGDVDLYNSAGSVNAIIDIEGWFQ